MSSKISKYVVLFRILLLIFIQHRSSKNSSHEQVYLFATSRLIVFNFKSSPRLKNSSKNVLRPWSLFSIRGTFFGGVVQLVVCKVCCTAQSMIAWSSVLWLQLRDYVEIAVPFPLGDECFMHVKHINSQIKRAKGNELLLWFQCQYRNCLILMSKTCAGVRIFGALAVLIACFILKRS